jgi:hypothetical protein
MFFKKQGSSKSLYYTLPIRSVNSGTINYPPHTAAMATQLSWGAGGVEY